MRPVFGSTTLKYHQLACRGLSDDRPDGLPPPRPLGRPADPWQGGDLAGDGQGLLLKQVGQPLNSPLLPKKIMSPWGTGKLVLLNWSKDMLELLQLQHVTYNIKLEWRKPCEDTHSLEVIRNQHFGPFHLSCIAKECERQPYKNPHFHDWFDNIHGSFSSSVPFLNLQNVSHNQLLWHFAGFSSSISSSSSSPHSTHEHPTTPCCISITSQTGGLCWL